MILTSEKLHNIEQTIINYKLKPATIPHNYPVALVTDLLDTISHLKRLKKRHQRTAIRQGESLIKILELATRSLNGVSNEDPAN